MKVVIKKAVVLEALEGSIVEVSESQFKLIQAYCDVKKDGAKETKEITPQKKETRKGKA